MLSDTRIRTIKPAAKPVRLYDQRVLYLEVTPSGGRWWRLKYRFEGREKLLSMGTYPDTGLKAARAKRDQARELLAQGVDPSNVRRAEKSSKSEQAINSFEAVAREWHTTVHEAQVSAGHAARTLIRLEQDVFPWFGGLAVSEIKAPPTDTPRVVPTDPDHVIAAALTGQADLIASGDKRDLLPLGSFEGIAIVTAREAVERLEARKET